MELERQTDDLFKTPELIPKKKNKLNPVVQIILMISLYTLIILSLSVIANIDTAKKAIADFFYNIKPISILGFQKLETQKPEGTVCHVEADITKSVSQGIVWKDNKIDIYDSLRFDKLIKTIKMPGMIKTVKCYIPYIWPDSKNPTYSLDMSFLEYESKVAPENLMGGTSNDCFILSVIYIKDDQEILENLSIPAFRFKQFNYINSKYRNKKDEDSMIELFQKLYDSTRLKQQLPPHQFEFIENPKHPFEYLTRNHFTKLKGRKLIAANLDKTYISSSDGKELFSISSDKIVRKIFTNSSPVKWDYFYNWGGRIIIVGYDGRSVYIQTSSGNGIRKYDTGLVGNLEKSFFFCNTSDRILDSLLLMLWDGSKLICFDNDSKRIIWVDNTKLKTVARFGQFVYLGNNKSAYIPFDMKKHEEYVFDGKPLGFSSTDFSFYDTNFDNFNLYRQFMPFTDKDISPVFLVKCNYTDDWDIKTFKTSGIKEPINNFYPVIEEGNPVFYFIGDKSIYRWENNCQDLTNLKPERLILDNSN
jgi:hypothetical protein